MTKAKLVSQTYAVQRQHRDAIALEKAEMLDGLSHRAHQHLHGSKISYIGGGEFEVTVPYDRGSPVNQDKIFNFLDSVIQEAYDALILT